MHHWHLQNKKALITGGTKGIGRAVLSTFLELGAEVLFVARNAAEVEQTAVHFKAAGFTLHGRAADICQETDRQQLHRWVRENWGSLDILVNNAGINIRKPGKDDSTAAFQKVLDLDLVAPYEICALFFDTLKAAEGAAVINIASVAGIMDARTGAPYGMAKSGLIQMSRNLAAEWAPHHIRVNTISPWFTATPATETILSNQEMKAQILSRTPMGRVAMAEEIAAAVAFLAMDKASFITGQNLLVDGGATSRIL